MAHGSKAGPTSRRQVSWQSAGRDWTREANGSCRQEASFSWRPLSDPSASERVCRSGITIEPLRGWTLKETTGLGGSSVLGGIVSKADTPVARLLRGQARQRQDSRSREEGLNAPFRDRSRAEVRSVAGQRLLSSLLTRHNACRGIPPDAPHGAVGERGDQGSTSGDGLLRGDLWGSRHGALDFVRDLSSCKEGDPRGGSAGSKTEASYEVPNSCACSAGGAGRKRGSTSPVLGHCATLAPLRDRSGRRVTKPPRIQSQAAASEDDRGRQKSHHESGRSRPRMLRAEREVNGNRLAAQKSISSFRN